MAPLTIYPDRRFLFWMTLAAVPLAAFLLAAAGAFLLVSGDLYRDRAVPTMQGALIALAATFGALTTYSVIWNILRLRKGTPALSIEDRGIRLLDRPPLSLAKRPVFVPWAEIAVLLFERGTGGGRGLRIKTRSGQTHRVIASALNTDLQTIQEECLKRAHKAGLIGTSSRRNYVLLDFNEWRLTPV
jgi:hypothetical protein